MNHQPAHHTLRAMALVDDALIKLVVVDFCSQSSKAFTAMAGRAKRGILVDHGRIVEIKVFDRPTYVEIAAALDVSSVTVRADLRIAWLRCGRR